MPNISWPLAFILIALSALSVPLIADGKDLSMADTSHPRVRILDPDGRPIEGVTVTAVFNGTYHNGTTGSSGWAVFADIDDGTFPPGTRFSASKEGFRTIEWSQGDPIPTMVVAREDDTLLVVLLLVMAAISVLVLLALSFREKLFGKVR